MRLGLLPAAAIASAIVAAGRMPGADAATPWVTGLAAVSAGQATSVAWAPPASVTSSCSSLVTITASWPAVPHASSYTVYQSTNGGAFTSVTTTSLTSYTTGSLSIATYAYKVTATVGANWTSAQSTASATRTLTVGLCS